MVTHAGAKSAIDWRLTAAARVSIISKKPVGFRILRGLRRWHGIAAGHIGG